MALQLPRQARHLRLRVLEARDLDAFLAYRSDPLVARFQGWEPMDEAQARTFLANAAGFTGLLPGRWEQLGIAALGDDRLIGDAGLLLAADGSEVEFGMSLSRAVQGRGLGTETAVTLLTLIFAATAVERVVANTDARNEPCRRALLRAGLEPTGVRTGTWKGEVCTEHGFAITRSAHETRQAGRNC